MEIKLGRESIMTVQDRPSAFNYPSAICQPRDPLFEIRSKVRAVRVLQAFGLIRPRPGRSTEICFRSKLHLNVFLHVGVRHLT